VEARSGRLLFGRRGSVLMDPASNQKVLATATALMRLGADWRFRTELAGPEPDAAGVIAGDVYLRGSGDPTVRNVDVGFGRGPNLQTPIEMKGAMPYAAIG